MEEWRLVACILKVERINNYISFPALKPTLENTVVLLFWVLLFCCCGGFVCLCCFLLFSKLDGEKRIICSFCYVEGME